MKNTRAYKSVKYCILFSSLSVLASCGASSGTRGSAPSIAISGSLSLGDSSQAAQKLGLNFSTKSMLLTDDTINMQTIDLTQYTAKCSTVSPPVKSGSSAVAANGTFSIDIAGGSGEPLSCYLVDADGNRAADFIISDSTKKDLNGKDEVSGTAAFDKNADLGTISFDPNAGEVVVPKTNIASSITATAPAAASVFDPTGVWTIGPVDFTLQPGASGPCAANEAHGGGGGNQCNGPAEGMALYFKLWKGIQTANNADVFGLQLWQDQAKFNGCGGKVGLSSDKQTELGLDFSSNGSTANQAFAFASSVAGFEDPITSTTSTVTLTDNWKMSTAKTLYPIQPNCGPRDIVIGGVTYGNAWACGPDNSSRYQFQLGGGCFDSAGLPAQIENWSTVTFGSQSTDVNGIRTQTSTSSQNIGGVTKTITCTNKYAVTTFTSGNHVVQTSNSTNFNWSDLNASSIAADTTCSSLLETTESSRMAKLRCYADYYYSSGIEQSNVCLPKVDMDWSATTAAAFAVVDKIRPNGLIFFEQFKPFADGSGGTMVTREEHYEGVEVKGNWVNCRVVETGALTIKKVSDTKLLANFQESTITSSTSKPVCMSKFSGKRKVFTFYLNK